MPFRPDTPLGSLKLSPATTTSAALAAEISGTLQMHPSGSVEPCKCNATCRAVGWSNTSVLDNATPSPAARCS
eukprot:7386417-Prymnesium_polylepis.2